LTGSDFGFEKTKFKWTHPALTEVNPFQGPTLNLTTPEGCKAEST